MKTWFVIFWFAIQAARAFAQPVRDHREVPGAAAQWKGVGGSEASLAPTALYNVIRKKNLAAKPSGELTWEATRPGAAYVMFENCTRAGEAIYSSDRVTIRFGSNLAQHATGSAAGLSLGGGTGCDFRLIPSGPGFVPVGSGDGTFAIYSIAANRYLTYKPAAAIAKVVLQWQRTPNGKIPRNVAARADFVPVEFLVTTGKIGERTVQTAYLTIQNIGSVRSSASQQSMKINVNGEAAEFLIIKPLEPNAIQRNPIPLTKPVSACTIVELDTNPDLKFQVGAGAFPNDDVFANDRKTLKVRTAGVDLARGLAAPVNCEAELVK